jgi:hypothetical protein
MFAMLMDPVSHAHGALLAITPLPGAGGGSRRCPAPVFYVGLTDRKGNPRA